MTIYIRLFKYRAVCSEINKTSKCLTINFTDISIYYLVCLPASLHKGIATVLEKGTCVHIDSASSLCVHRDQGTQCDGSQKMVIAGGIVCKMSTML